MKSKAFTPRIPASGTFKHWRVSGMVIGDKLHITGHNGPTWDIPPMTIPLAELVMHSAVAKPAATAAELAA